MKTYNRVMYADYFGGTWDYKACMTTNGQTVRYYSTTTLDELLTIARAKNCNRFIFEFIAYNGYLTHRYEIPLM